MLKMNKFLLEILYWSLDLIIKPDSYNVLLDNFNKIKMEKVDESYVDTIFIKYDKCQEFQYETDDNVFINTRVYGFDNDISEISFIMGYPFKSFLFFSRGKSYYDDILYLLITKYGKGFRISNSKYEYRYKDNYIDIWLDYSKIAKMDSINLTLTNCKYQKNLYSYP
jgi:hypothetical protein